ncbi:MAG: DUF3135 domain-containing protein [Smithella sp.]
MNKSNPEEELKIKTLKWHNQMSRLFMEDRLAFERERKRLLEEFFNSIKDDEKCRRLRTMQASFDQKMMHAGSGHNRFVLAQTIFWDHFHNVWHPGIQKMSALLKSFVKNESHSSNKNRMAVMYDIDKYRRL